MLCYSIGVARQRGTQGENQMIYDNKTMKTVQFDVQDRNGADFVAVLIYEGKRVTSAYAGLR